MNNLTNSKNGRRAWISILIFLLFSSCTGNSSTTTTSSLNHVSSFGSNPGNLNMYYYAPQNISGSAPLVIALHGCTQSANDYINAGWNGLADTYKFYVVYAEQQAANNSSLCFNWFLTTDNQRDQGEAYSIKQMVDYMKSSFSINSSKVYVTGLSAGGAMAAVELAAYPDVYAAGSIHSGLPYGCASSFSTTNCMSGSDTQTASSWGTLVHNAYPSYAGSYPKVSIWQGDSDPTVNVNNLTELMKQWTNIHGGTQTPSVSETVKGESHQVYNVSSTPIVETYTISGGSHALAINPGAGIDQGGTVASFFIDYGIFSSYYAAKFWGLIP